MFLKLVPSHNLLVTSLFVLGLVVLLLLVKMIKMMIDQQIDDQMEKMIPLKSLRSKISVRIRWR